MLSERTVVSVFWQLRSRVELSINVTLLKQNTLKHFAKQRTATLKERTVKWKTGCCKPGCEVWRRKLLINGTDCISLYTQNLSQGTITSKERHWSYVWHQTQFSITKTSYETSWNWFWLDPQQPVKMNVNKNEQKQYGIKNSYINFTCTYSDIKFDLRVSW